MTKLFTILEKKIKKTAKIREFEKLNLNLNLKNS